MPERPVASLEIRSAPNNVRSPDIPATERRSCLKVSQLAVLRFALDRVLPY